MYNDNDGELSNKNSTVGLSKYLRNTQDWMLILVTSQEKNWKLHSIIQDSERFSREQGIEMPIDEERIPTTIDRKPNK